MDRKQREDAINEVHVLKAMRHPYIITYKESFMDKRCLCIVMDYADGGDLYTKIANQKKIGKGILSQLWLTTFSLLLRRLNLRLVRSNGTRNQTHPRSQDSPQRS
jgi:NIMA (never in mitosis gene a)-related kinase